MGLPSIEAPVGLGGHNHPIDVAVIQQLLKTYFTQYVSVKGRSTSVIPPPIQIDGECTQVFIELTKNVQSTALGMKHPDGRIDPMGKTLKQITAQTNPRAANACELLFGPLPPNAGLLSKVNPQRFRKGYIKQAGLGLAPYQGRGLARLFQFSAKRSRNPGHSLGGVYPCDRA